MLDKGKLVYKMCTNMHLTEKVKIWYGLVYSLMKHTLCEILLNRKKLDSNSMQSVESEKTKNFV